MERFAGANIEPLGTGVEVRADNRRYYLNGIKLLSSNHTGDGQPTDAPRSVELKPGTQLSLCLTGERDERAADDRPLLTRVELAAPYSAINSTIHHIQLLVRPFTDSEVLDRAFPIGDLACIDNSSTAPSAVIAQWLDGIRQRASMPQQPPAQPPKVRASGRRSTQRASSHARNRRRRGMPAPAVALPVAPAPVAVPPSLALQLVSAACQGTRQSGDQGEMAQAYQLGLLATLVASGASQSGVELLANAIALQKK